MQNKLFGVGLLLAGTALLTPTVNADVTDGNSKGYGIYVALELIGIPVLTIPETAVSVGSAPGIYNETAQVLSVGLSVPLVASVGTGVLESSAFSDVNGAAGNRLAYAGALVDDLDIILVPQALGGPPLLALSADRSAPIRWS